MPTNVEDDYRADHVDIVRRVKLAQRGEEADGLFFESGDVKALRLAGKAILRNLQRLEDVLDDARSKVSS
jgi:hypothetical protein